VDSGRLDLQYECCQLRGPPRPGRDEGMFLCSVQPPSQIWSWCRTTDGAGHCDLDSDPHDQRCISVYTSCDRGLRRTEFVLSSRSHQTIVLAQYLILKEAKPWLRGDGQVRLTADHRTLILVWGDRFVQGAQRLSVPPFRGLRCWDIDRTLFFRSAL
jgi:hypothetical protein